MMFYRETSQLQTPHPQTNIWRFSWKKSICEASLSKPRIEFPRSLTNAFIFVWINGCSYELTVVLDLLKSEAFQYIANFLGMST
jgi:hypothetical protein